MDARQRPCLKDVSAPGLASGGLSMGGGLLAAAMGEGDTAGAGLFIGVAGVIGTMITSITPWVRAWFEDRKGERDYRAQRLQEQLDEAKEEIAELLAKAPQITKNSGDLANMKGVNEAMFASLRAAGWLGPSSSEDIPIDSPPQPRLLVAEDSLSTIQALSRLFTGAGFAVDSATSLPDALQALQVEPCPKWVTVDLKLDDGETGLELLEAVRKNCPNTKTAVITGAGPETERYKAAQEFGPDVFLRKPVLKLDELLTKIRP